MSDTLSTWGGPINCFLKVGNVAYCGIGSRLVVLDLSDEANIHELGSVTFQGCITDVVVRGSYAYACGRAETCLMNVVDIANPASMSIVWQASYGPTAVRSPKKLQVYSNTLFVNGAGGLDAYDLSNPAALDNGVHVNLPRPVQDPTVSVADFEVAGDLLYVGDENNRLMVYDLHPADPTHPTFRGQCSIQNDSDAQCRHLAVNGTRVVLTSNWQWRDGINTGSSHNTVTMFDVANPSAPVPLGTLDDFYIGWGVALRGNLAIVADWYPLPAQPQYTPLTQLKGLAIVDFANPLSPTTVGTYNTDHSSMYDAKVIGDRAYVLDVGQGLVVLDISDPANPVRVGGYYSPGHLGQMTKVGDLLYVADVWNGFTILNVSNPAAPSVVGVYRSVGDIRHQNNWMVAVHGNLAYLAAGYGGIQVVDVSNPANPTLVTQYTGTSGAAPASVQALEVDGSVLHTVQARFEALTCSFSAPTYVNYDLSAGPQSLSVLGYGCLNNAAQKLMTRSGITFTSYAQSPIDDRDPANPALRPSLPLITSPDLSRVDDIAIDGDYLYVANDSSGNGYPVTIFDISDPLSPVRLGMATNFAYNRHAVAASGNWAFSSDSGYLYVLNVTNRAAPSLEFASPTGGGTNLLAETGPSGLPIIYSTSTGDYSPSGAVYTFQGLKVRRLRCKADFDGNGEIAPADIASFVNAWLNGLNTGGLAADFDGNGRVEPADIAAFINTWLNGLQTGCHV
ncbi:MAG: hypothetical protein KF745_02820 [Phycisphaeraceae bacterium]|nr:hypothetical protein [Phycisphaeraceae bacterium]